MLDFRPTLQTKPSSSSTSTNPQHSLPSPPFGQDANNATTQQPNIKITTTGATAVTTPSQLFSLSPPSSPPKNQPSSLKTSFLPNTATSSTEFNPTTPFSPSNASGLLRKRKPSFLVRRKTRVTDMRKVLFVSKRRSIITQAFELAAATQETVNEDILNAVAEAERKDQEISSSSSNKEVSGSSSMTKFTNPDPATADEEGNGGSKREVVPGSVNVVVGQLRRTSSSCIRKSFSTSKQLLSTARRELRKDILRKIKKITKIKTTAPLPKLNTNVEESNGDSGSSSSSSSRPNKKLQSQRNKLVKKQQFLNSPTVSSQVDMFEQMGNGSGSGNAVSRDEKAMSRIARDNDEMETNDVDDDEGNTMYE